MGGECVDGRDADKEAEEKRRLGPVQPWTTPNQPLQPFQRRPELPIMMMTRMLSDFLDVNSSFLDNYHKMRDANTKGADKYFHCMAHCRASRSGPYAAGFAEHLGNAREVWDQHVKGYPRWDSVSDQAANAAGRNGPLSMPCEAVCSQFRPAGLSSNY